MSYWALKKIRQDEQNETRSKTTRYSPKTLRRFYLTGLFLSAILMIYFILESFL